MMRSLRNVHVVAVVFVLASGVSQIGKAQQSPSKDDDSTTTRGSKLGKIVESLLASGVTQIGNTQQSSSSDDDLQITKASKLGSLTENQDARVSSVVIHSLAIKPGDIGHSVRGFMSSSETSTSSLAAKPDASLQVTRIANRGTVVVSTPGGASVVGSRKSLGGSILDREHDSQVSK
jgi:hypothetical protein